MSTEEIRISPQKTRKVEGGGKVLDREINKALEEGYSVDQVIRLREVGKYLLLLRKTDCMIECERAEAEALLQESQGE